MQKSCLVISKKINAIYILPFALPGFGTICGAIMGPPGQHWSRCQAGPLVTARRADYGVYHIKDAATWREDHPEVTGIPARNLSALCALSPAQMDSCSYLPFFLCIKFDLPGFHALIETIRDGFDPRIRFPDWIVVAATI